MRTGKGVSPPSKWAPRNQRTLYQPLSAQPPASQGLPAPLKPPKGYCAQCLVPGAGLQLLGPQCQAPLNGDEHPATDTASRQQLGQAGLLGEWGPQMAPGLGRGVPGEGLKAYPTGASLGWGGHCGLLQTPRPPPPGAAAAPNLANTSPPGLRLQEGETLPRGLSCVGPKA